MFLLWWRLLLLLRAAARVEYHQHLGSGLPPVLCLSFLGYLSSSRGRTLVELRKGRENRSKGTSLPATRKDLSVVYVQGWLHWTSP